MRARHSLILIAAVFSGCAGNIVDSNLSTSNTIFLPPSQANTVYLQNRNMSDNQQVTLTDLGTKIGAKGYTVVNDPETAQYWVQTNIVYCNQEPPDLPMEAMVSGGFGSSIVGTLGSVLGVAGSMHPVGAASLGILSAAQSAVGGLVGSVGGLFGGGGSSSKQTDERIYACVADIQITERMKPADSKGLGLYQTRMAAGVHQKKLDLAEATPLLQEKLSTAVAGHF